MYFSKHIDSETNLILFGPTNVGKTSLVSQITYEQCDNGNGYSRKLSLKHNHEQLDGNSSDIKTEFIGFKENSLINYFTGFNSDMEDIYTMSDRYVTITDLPGNVKYLRTTLYGLLSSKHDIITISIPAKDTQNILNQNRKMYTDIINICFLYKRIPLLLLTKIDLVSSEELLGSLLSVNIFFNNLGLENIVQFNNHSKIDFSKHYIIPLSNINSTGINVLVNYLSQYSQIVKNYQILENKNTLNYGIDSAKTLFIINEVFNIPSTGIIIYGYVKYGSISVNNNINIFYNGKIVEKRVKSIHKKMIESNCINSGESGCLQFYNLSNRNIDKTAIIFSNAFKKHIQTEIIFTPIDCGNIPLEKQYLLFNGSTIHPVNIYKEIKDNEEIIKYKSINNTPLFIQLNSVTILKDDLNNTFIGISNSVED